MYMDGPARAVDITPSLFLSSVLEYVSHGQLTDRKQPRSYAGSTVACITAVKEPNNEYSASACCTSAAAGDCLSVSGRSWRPVICNAERPVRASMHSYCLVSLAAACCLPGVLLHESGGSCTAASPAAALAVGPPQALRAVGGNESRLPPGSPRLATTSGSTSGRLSATSSPLP